MKDLTEERFDEICHELGDGIDPENDEAVIVVLNKGDNVLTFMHGHATTIGSNLAHLAYKDDTFGRIVNAITSTINTAKHLLGGNDKEKQQ